MQSTLELKAFPLLEVKPIERRANCKIVQVAEKSYLIGGMTAEAISNLIYQFRFNKDEPHTRLEWRQMHFDNDLFSPRNSFAACAANGRVYIWGGLEMNGTQQKALSDFIEIDMEKGKMREIALKNPIKIHSASLFFDEQKSQFVGYGGSDENTNVQAFLYKLKFQPGQQNYEWQKVSVNCPQHQGYVWQHSASFTPESFFNGEKGAFLTVVGGCRLPHTPYKTIVEINTETAQVTNSIELDKGLVSHDSVIRQGRLYTFGGSNGGDFNSVIYVLQKGKVTKLKGHRAIGCSCCLLQGNKIIVYGGVCGQASINGAFLYQ